MTDTRQTILMDKLREYYVTKEIARARIKDNNTPSLSEIEIPKPIQTGEGLCAGLVAYYLYRIANDELGKFQYDLEYVANWDKSLLAIDNIDLKMEEFLHVILGLHEMTTVIPHASRNRLHTSVNLLLQSSQPQVTAPEFSLSFVFGVNDIAPIISQIPNNKMVRISNSLHVIGLIRKNNVYNLYDPNSPYFTREFSDLNELAQAIFSDLSISNKPSKYIVLNFTIYDLEGSIPGIYAIEPLRYYKSKLESQATKQEVFKHKYFLNLLAKFHEYELMDLLFELEYKPTDWTKDKVYELADAVKERDTDMVRYLIKHNLPIDRYTDIPFNQPSALGNSIINKDLPMMYLLLFYGANPNKPAMRESNTSLTSYLQLCLNTNFTDGIILLLACGMNLDESDLTALKSKYGYDFNLKICIPALELQAEFLKTPNEISNLNAASGDMLCKLAMKTKLRKQLGHVNLIVANYEGHTINGETVVQALIDIYNSRPVSESFTVSNKHALHKILKHFDPTLPEYNIDFDDENRAEYQVKELIKQLNDALDRIDKKIEEFGIDKISEEDQLELEQITEDIIKLGFEPGGELSNNDEQHIELELDRIKNFKKHIKPAFNIFTNKSLTNSEDQALNSDELLKFFQPKNSSA